MNKKVLLAAVVFSAAFFGWSNISLAAAPQITSVKYKGGGDGTKIVVIFDQPVYNTASSSGALAASDFVLGGTTGATSTITAVDHAFNPPSRMAVLTINNQVNPAGAGDWTVAAATGEVFNAFGQQATTTAFDLNAGTADSDAPWIIGIYQHSMGNLDVMFSEEVDGTNAGNYQSYTSLTTSAVGDTPAVTGAQLVPEKNFAILTVSTSTVLGWGPGNTLSVDTNPMVDLVGNASIPFPSITILPAIKISEVKIGSATNSQDEFIELYNFSDVALDTSNLKLHVKNGADDFNIPLTFLRNSVGDKGFYLIGNGSYYSGSVSLDATYSSSTDFLTGNSAVYISASSTPGELKIDAIGMGTSTVQETANLAALAAGSAYERKSKPDSTNTTLAAGGVEEFKGNSSDTNNSSQDFVLQATPRPQNSLSSKEFPFGGPGANDTAGPQVMGSFPGGNPGEMVPNNLDYIGFGLNEPVQENTVTLSTVEFYVNSFPGTNLCQSVTYNNMPQPGVPMGKCIINPSAKPLGAVPHTFKIHGDNTNATSSVAVRDFNSNALNQPGGNKGDAFGNYVVTFTPSSGGEGFNFMAPPSFVMGTMPFPGAVNLPTNIKKIFVKFSGDMTTSTLNTTNIKLIKVSDSSEFGITSIAALSSDDDEFVSDIAALTLSTSSALLANTQYRVTINNVTDTGSRTLNPFMADFTTGAGPDNTGPRVVGKLPSIATGVPVNAIDIHAMTDDKIDPSTVLPETVKVKQGTNEIPGETFFDPFTGEIMFFGNNVFQANTAYTVSLEAAAADPCVRNISGTCLQDDDGNANNKYEFQFTTGGADVTPPRVMFSNADQRNLSISFDEPVNEMEAEELSNYALLLNGTSSPMSSMAGQKVFYDPVGRTTVIENLNLPIGANFTLTASNIHDLSGNLIGAQNSAQGTVQDMSKTMGFVGPGGPPPSDMMGPMPQNFSTSTYGFVPPVEIRPWSPMAGATTGYSVNIPISKQIATSTGKVVLTFPTGFDISAAALDTFSPTANDINGPGPGTIGVSPLTLDSGARTITVTFTENTRCDTGNVAPCPTTNTQDFLKFDLRNIVNSAIPKDTASNGYSVDVKTMASTTVLEALTSNPFYLSAGGTGALVVTLNAGVQNTGTTTIRMFSPMSGPREAVSTVFNNGTGTSTFTGLMEGDYGVFTEPVVTLDGSDYLGRAMPTPARVNAGATSTLTLTLPLMDALPTLTVNVTGPAGKNIDVFANSADKFTVKTLTTNGAQQSVQMKLVDGSWFVGVGPAMPKGPYSGPPPAPDFVMQPPMQVIVANPSIQENSGTANDGTISFVLSAASQTIGGQVVDSSNRAIVGAEVFAYAPMGGFGTHGTTDGMGKFSLRVGPGMYQIGSFSPGLPPSSEISVEVRGDGTLVANGAVVSSVMLKLIKPERTISGKVLDQNNNPAQGAGVFAYCDPSVNNNPCFGPGGGTGSPTNSDGSYTLYVKAGTWKVGAFLPGFGELPQVSKVVTTADLSDVNFYPNTNTTFNTVSGTVCKDTHGSGNATTCGSGDAKASGVFVRAYSDQGANQTVSAQDGTYSIKVPASNNYTLEAYDPALGRLKSLANVDISTSTTGKDFVVGNPLAVTVNVKNASGDPVSINQMFIDFFNFTDQMGNHLEIRNSTSSSISLPAGSYKVKASLPGKTLGNSAVQSDNGATAVATTTATVTVDGVETIKIVLPDLAIVSGTVYSGSVGGGNELADAFVQFSDPASGIFVGTQANSSGAYSLKIPYGTYNIFAQKPGYLANPISLEVATSSISQNLIVSPGALLISGTLNVAGSAASKGFVMARKLGGGFSSSQTNSAGAFSLAVNNGTWRLYGVAEGYAETEYTAPIEINNASVANLTLNLTTPVSLQPPKVCQITPAQGGECADATNGVSVIVPPSAFGSGTSAATLTIKQTNARQETSGSKPVGQGFDFEVTDSSGNKINTFNSAVTLEFIQTKAVLAASGIDTKAEVDAVKVTLWSEAVKDYDVLVTTVEYLDASNGLIGSPAADLSNVAKIKFKALTTHFSGGGPGLGGDSLSPAAPAGVSGSGSDSAVAVSWLAVTTNSDGSAISDLADYRVWRSTATGSGFSAIATVTSPTVSYSDTSAVAGTTYYYRVTARDTNGNESSQSASSAGAARTSAGADLGGGSRGGGSNSPVTPVATTTQPALTTATTTLPVISKITASVRKIVRRLVLGMVSDEVKWLQEILAQDKSIYPEGIINGNFGPLTLKAVKKFQEKNGIAKPGEDGYGEVGPNTRLKINQLLAGTQGNIPQLPAQAASSAERNALIRSQIQVLQQQLVKLLTELAKMLASQKTAQ